MISTKRNFVCALLFVAALCVSTTVPGQAVFNGTWRTDQSKTKFDTKPFVFYTSQGWFHCDSCSPAFDVQADGQDHAMSVPGLAFDTFNVTPVDQHTIHIVGKGGGKTLLDQTLTVSADGKILTVKSDFYPANGSSAVHSEGTSKRVGILAVGVHPTSGNWQAQKSVSSENGLLVTYKVDGDAITSTDPSGESYTAKLDGSDSPVKGSVGWDMVSLKLVDPRTIQETDKYLGKIIAVSKMTVGPNGKVITVMETDQPSGRQNRFILTKQ